MLSKINIENKIASVRSRRISEQDILAEVHSIFEKNDRERQTIITSLQDKSDGSINNFDFDLLDPSRIYHIKDIEKLCIDYRLRFLDSRFFKGGYPDEAITAIRELENKHHTTVTNCKIVAPAKLMKLENADDPLLMAPMGNDYFYLIHKWGNDLHPLRKLQMWPYKSFENLLATIFVLSIILTGMIPMHLFTLSSGEMEYVMLFLFVFKGVAGAVLYYGFAKGKNFNKAIWRSKYYNA